MGSQGTPGKQGESAQVTWCGGPAPSALSSVGRAPNAGVCGAVDLLPLETPTSGWLHPPASRLEEDVDEEEEEEVVGGVFLLEFGLVPRSGPSAP